jgi:hypothetical protein
MNTNEPEQGHKDTNFLNLSTSELSVLNDKEFFRLKRSCIDKIVTSFGKLEYLISGSISELSGITGLADYKGRGNISKGENYLGLPYVVLDHPAVFGKAGVAAFRTMFWWGNGFSITLHLSGNYLEKLPAGFFQSVLDKSPGHFLIGTGNGEWDHHFGKDNFTMIGNGKFNSSELLKQTTEKGFFKLADQWEIEQSNEITDKVTNFLSIVNDAVRKS